MWICEKCGRSFRNTGQDHYCGKIETIDQYIAEQSEETRPVLQKIRSVIQAAAPLAEERVSWQMPTFWQNENLIHFAAFKKHISIFPGVEAVSFYVERLAVYNTAKGTIQLPLDKPIPYDLISDITLWRVAAAESSKKSNEASKSTRRKVHEVPDYITSALDENGLWEHYRARPPYQRNDYIGWIISGKREETRQKRLSQMLEELLGGDAYMGMAYNSDRG